MAGAQENDRNGHPNRETMVDEHKNQVEGTISDIKGIGKPEIKALTEFLPMSLWR